MKTATLRAILLTSVALAISACSSNISEEAQLQVENVIVETTESVTANDVIVDVPTDNNIVVESPVVNTSSNGAYYRIIGDFGFDSNKADLGKKGNELVDNVALQLKSSNAYNISITGYTDSMGKEAYNLKLSKKRAENVKKRLIQQGVTAEINTVGLGSQNPVKTCSPTKNKKALRECLRPNRRVEISANAG